MSDSEGLFARRHLEKYGWKKGKGLGRSETGITDAIKPKLKFDTAGIGHDAGEQFSFHWWDHVFNKAAKNIQIENDEDGVKVRQKGNKTNLITNKRTTHDKKNKSLLYGSFVKHGTLNSDGVISQDKELSSSSDDSDDDKPPDTYEGNDEMLFKACGGRTAHKGARHGLHLSGKLQRIEEQDNHHSNMMKIQIVTNGALSDDEMERKENNQTVKNRMKTKEKKHRSKERRKGEEENAKDANGIHVQEEEITSGENIDLEQKPSKRKKKRKHLDNSRNLETITDVDGIGEEAVNENLILTEIQLKEDDESIDAEMYKKKKSKKEKKKKRTMKEINSKEFGMNDSQEDSLSTDEPTRKKKSKKKKRIELDDKVIHPDEELRECREQKDSKRKRKKERIAINECVDNDTGNEVRIVDVEVLKPKKKKKKQKE